MSQLRQAQEIHTAGGELLRASRLFDLYRGEGVPAGKKSLAYALTYQADDRTLTDKEIDKLDRHTTVIFLGDGRTNYANPRLDLMKTVADRSELVDPTDPGVIASRSVRLAETGRCAEAYAENQRAQELAPNNNKMLLSLVGVQMKCGKPGKMRRLLEEVERRPDAPGIGVYLAEVYTAQGEVDSAFAWLERARWNMLTRMELRVSGRLKPLRADPRYRRLLDRMGLP